MTNENITLEGTAYLYDDSRIGGQVTNVYAYDNAVVEDTAKVAQNAFLYGTSTFAGSAATIVADANATVLSTAYATGDVVLKGSATFAGTVSGNVVLDENATFTGSASGNIKIKDTATFTGQYGGTSAVYVPAVVFTNAAGGNAWSLVGNWTDLNGNAATDLPVAGASIIINANIAGDANLPLLNTVTVSSNADLGQNLNVLNGVTFLGSSRLVNTTITGNAVFNDTSYNTGAIIGNAIFNNSSYNEENVNGFATFNDSSYNTQGANVEAAVFNTSSYNAGTITNASVFNGYSYNSGTVQGNAVLNDIYTYNTGTINGITVDNRSVPYIEWASGNTFVYTNLSVTDINNNIVYQTAQLNSNRTLNDLLINGTFGINSTNEQFTTDSSGYATYKSTASSIQEGGYVYRDKNTNIYYSDAGAASILQNAEFTINNVSYATDNAGIGVSYKSWSVSSGTIYTTTNTSNLSGATAYSNKILTTYPASGTEIGYNGDTFSVGPNGLLTYVNVVAVKSWNTSIGTLYTASTNATNPDGLNVFSDVGLQTVATNFSYGGVGYYVNNNTGAATGSNDNTVTNSNNESVTVYSHAYENGQRVYGLDSNPPRESITLYSDAELTSLINFNFTIGNLYWTQTNGTASPFSIKVANTNIGEAWTAYANMADGNPDGNIVKGDKTLGSYAGAFDDVTINGTDYYFDTIAERLYGYRAFCGVYTLPFTTGISGNTWYIDKQRSVVAGSTNDEYSECSNDGIHYKISNGTISEWSKEWDGFTACDKQSPTTVYTDVNVNALAIGVTLYSDIQKASPVNDIDFILANDTHLATDANGVIDSITTCPY